MLLLFYIKNNLCYVKTSNIVPDPVTKIVLHFYVDLPSRFLKQM